MPTQVPGSRPDDQQQPLAMPDFFDFLLTRLELAEQLVYGEAFRALDVDTDGYVPVDDQALRDFIVAHSAVLVEELDLKLSDVAFPGRGLRACGFLRLLQENAVPQNAAMKHYLGLLGPTSESDKQLWPHDSSLVLHTCRRDLCSFAHQWLGPAERLGPEEYERILDAAMFGVDIGSAAFVSMDAWLALCERVARTIRVALCADAVNTEETI